MKKLAVFHGMEPIGCPETSVRNNHSTLRKFSKRAQFSGPKISLQFSQTPITVFSANTHNTITRFYALFSSDTFSGILAKLRKPTVSLAMSVCIDQLGSHWMGFRENCYLSFFFFFWKISHENSVSLKSCLSNGFFT